MSVERRAVRSRVFLASGLIQLLIAAIPCPSARAQVLYGSVVGSVSDQTQAAVPGVKVTLTNHATGQTRGTTSDPVGRFSFVDVLPGTYDLNVTATGFKAYSKTGLETTINTVTRVDAELQVGVVTE